MINKAILTGRLTRDPEYRTTQSGISIANFTLAVDRRFKNSQGEYEADFINCTAWRNTAEFICKYFKKGALIGVVGSIQTRNYEDKNGNKRTAVEVVVDEAHFCGESKGGNGESRNFEDVPEDVELPF